MDKKIILVLGNDKISRRAFSHLKDLPFKNQISVFLDRSTDPKRVLRLVLKGRLSLRAILKMIFADILRSDAPPIDASGDLTTNKDLVDKIVALGAKKVFLFHAGLIINKSVIDLGVPILNIHCANVPEFGGLQSILRALDAKKYEQNATLHRVVTKIDSGEVLDTEPYQLDPAQSYLKNEDQAYAAGIRLLSRNLTAEFTKASTSEVFP